MLDLITRSFALVIVLGIAAVAPACDADAAPAAVAPATEAGVTPYPLTFCVTCGDDLASEKESVVTKQHKGREVKLCKGCVKIYNADPEGYLKQVDKAIKTGKPVEAGH